jgi:hypothetical protein
MIFTHPAAAPGFKHQYCPQGMSVVLVTRNMLQPKPANHCGIEGAASKPPAVEKVFRPIAQRSTQPAGQWYCKSCFRTTYEISWDVPIQHAS